MVTKLIRRNRRWEGDCSRRAKGGDGGERTRGHTGEGVHRDHHFFFGGEDFVKVVTVEIRMKKKNFSHDGDLHESLLVSDGAGKTFN